MAENGTYRGRTIPPPLLIPNMVSGLTEQPGEEFNDESPHPLTSPQPLMRQMAHSPGNYEDELFTENNIVISKANADKVTGKGVDDKSKIEFPFMCDGLMSSQRNSILVTYINRLLNKELKGSRVVELEPMLTYSGLSKLAVNPLEGEAYGYEVQLVYNKRESPLKAFEKWLQLVNYAPLNKLRVRYLGEPGADVGGLRKAFMSELAQEIKQKYCESVFEVPLVCRVREDTDMRVSAMKLDRYGEIGPSVNMNALVTGEAPSMIGRSTSVPVSPAGLTSEQRYEQVEEVLALIRKESSINSRLAMINMEKKRLLNKRKRLSDEIRKQSSRAPSKVAGSRRSSKKGGAISVSGLAKTMKATKDNNMQATAKLSQLNKEEAELKTSLVSVQKKIRSTHARIYTTDNTSKSKKKPTVLVNIFDTMKKQIYASEPQRFNFRVTSKTDPQILVRLNVTINTIASALCRHIIKDCIITGQTLSFGFLRLPAVYILTLASLCKSKNATFGSLYDMLSMNYSDLSRNQLMILCEVYNMCVKLDSETYDQMEEYTLNDDKMVELLADKESMLNYVKVKDVMYFGNRTNKRLVMLLLQQVYNKLANSVNIDSHIWKTNLSGMTLLRVFMPYFVIEPNELLKVIQVNGRPILEYRSDNPELMKILNMIMSLIREQDTFEKSVNLLNLVRNITGSLSLPSNININIDNILYDAWKPVIVYHTCFNSMDLRVNLLIPLLKNEKTLIKTLSNYLFGDFSGNMGLA